MPRRLLSPIVLAAAVVAGLALAWLAWRAEPAADADRGRPQRIILFGPNLNEAAWVLGFGARLVAVTDYCIWPARLARLPSVGGMVDPNLERIAGLDPDLLVIQGEAVSLRNFARRENIRTERVTMDGDLESIFGGIAELGALLGDRARGEAVADSLRRELAAVSAAADRTSAPEVMLVLGHDPGRLTNLVVVGPGTYLQDLVARVGGRPVPADAGALYRSYSVEALVARPPDLLVDLRPGVSTEEVAEEDLARAARELGLEKTRVRTLRFEGSLIPGPRVVDTARHLRDLLREEAHSP